MHTPMLVLASESLLSRPSAPSTHQRVETGNYLQGKTCLCRSPLKTRSTRRPSNSLPRSHIVPNQATWHCVQLLSR
jgi:hypothetical protein